MDLRRKLSSTQVEQACAVLNYQPFVLTDDIQTGAAYNWAYGVDIRNPSLVYRRTEQDGEWDKITDSNARLRHMYDDFMSEIGGRYKDGSFLDMGCNNGYLPVRAEELGMRKGYGVDRSPLYAESMRFWNDVLGTSAEYQFAHGAYVFASGEINML